MDDHDSIDVKIAGDEKHYTYYLGLLPICVLLIIIFARVSFVLCKSYVKNAWIRIVITPIVVTIFLLLCLIWNCYKSNKKIMNEITAVLIFMVINIVLFWVVYGLMVRYFGQKTRTPTQRRMYVGSRARQSLSQTEPTIYVSPANLPPPPKYECLAPPSYEEVVGIHYPQYQSQPITQPIAAAMAQSTNVHSSDNNTSTVNEEVDNPPPTTVTVTSETQSRRT